MRLFEFFLIEKLAFAIFIHRKDVLLISHLEEKIQMRRYRFLFKTLSVPRKPQILQSFAIL